MYKKIKIKSIKQYYFIRLLNKNNWNIEVNKVVWIKIKIRIRKFILNLSR